MLNSAGRRIRFKFIDCDSRRDREFIRKSTFALTVVYYELADAIVILYDIANAASFNSVNAWLLFARRLAQRKRHVFLVGAKKDLGESRQVERKAAESFARSNRLQFREVSAKDAKGTGKLLERISACALQGKTEPSKVYEDKTASMCTAI